MSKGFSNGNGGGVVAIVYPIQTIITNATDTARSTGSLYAHSLISGVTTSLTPGILGPKAHIK